MKPTYQDALAAYGIGGAHPGGAFVNEKDSEEGEHQPEVQNFGCGLRDGPNGRLSFEIFSMFGHGFRQSSDNDSKSQTKVFR